MKPEKREKRDAAAIRSKANSAKTTKKDSENNPKQTTRDQPAGVLGSKMDRRGFMKTATAATAVVGASAVALTSIKPLELYTSTSSTSSNQQTATVDPFAAQTVTLIVNGASYAVSVEPRDMLGNVLREDLGLIGTKRPCNRGECGGCAVLIDGVVHYSDNYPAIRLGNGQQILTVEAGVGAKNPDPVISALQQAWVTEDAGQCAYCAPGMIMSAAGLLKANANPTVAQIKAALSGNICRCGAYIAIIAAVQAAATSLQGTG